MCLPYTIYFIDISRLDVELALQTGTPLFHVDELSLTDVLGVPGHTKEDAHDSFPRLPPALLQVLTFANVLNAGANQGGTKLDPLSYTESVTALFYQLFEVAPLGKPNHAPEILYEDVAYLTALAFMTTLLPKYGRGHTTYTFLCARLKTVMRDFHINSGLIWDVDHILLLLWALFVNAISVFKHENRLWLSELILETCKLLGLYHWEAIHHQLCVFPWVDSIHNGPGQRAWQEAQALTIEVREPT